MRGWATAAACLALSLLTFFQFPGHTYLLQDTQIYLPILEHLRDPAVLRNEMLAEHPHVAYTLYDEVSRFLRGASGLSFREVLMVQQIVTRAVGIWGLYLMALGLGLPAGPAAMVAAICALGASVLGPEVLTWEYEPTPRAFAVPLLLCGIGLAAHKRYVGAGIAGAIAFLYHPPTTIPFWAAFCVVLVLRRKFVGMVPLLAAGGMLAIAASAQAGEGQGLLSRITPLQEQLQRLRASYVWISSWPHELIWHYLILSAILAVAFVRIRGKVPADLRIFLLGLPALGLLSMPLSWLLLEREGWALIPQIQPMRALLFVTLGMQFLTAAAGFHAIQRRRLWEAFGWFVLAYLLPLHSVIVDTLPWRRAAVVLVLAALTAAATRVDWRLTPVAVLAAFFAIPIVAGVVNHPHLHTPEIAQLVDWARKSTPQDSVFLFPDAGRTVYPGIFRAEALRAVYVDWKGGGQVNYLRDFGEQWWFRWQQTMAKRFAPADFEKYGGLGIAYVVLHVPNRLPRQSVFENSKYLAYEVR